MRYYKMSIIKLIPFITIMLICSVAYPFEGYATYYTKASCKREFRNLCKKGYKKYCSDAYKGIKTANGEYYDENDLTCALPWRPDGRKYIIYSSKTNRTILVRHNDYGPGKGPRLKGVIIDLTPRAWNDLGYRTLDQGGVGHIKVNVMGVE